MTILSNYNGDIDCWRKMQFNSVKRGNFSGLARSVSKSAAQAFDAARSTATDHTAIAKEAIKGRSMERRAAMEAEGKVARAGLQAFAKVKDTKNDIDSAKKINDIKRPAKRMAGIVAGLGALTTGYVTMEENKKTKAENDQLRAERDAITAKQEARWAESDKRSEELLQLLKGNSGDSSSGDSSSSSGSSDSETSLTPSTNSSTTDISSGDALDSGKGTSGGGKTFSQSQIESLAVQAGFSAANAKTMAAISMGESRGNSAIDTVQSGLDPGKKNEYSIGLTQINTQAHGDKLSRRGWTNEDLRDPLKNLTIAKEVFDEVGSFKPWSVYTSGKYTQYLK